MKMDFFDKIYQEKMIMFK